MNVVALLGVDNGDDLAPQKSQGHESLFGIAETVIFIRVRDALEHLFGINEVEAPCFVRFMRRFRASQVITGLLYIRHVYSSRKKLFGG